MVYSIVSNAGPVNTIVAVLPPHIIVGPEIDAVSAPTFTGNTFLCTQPSALSVTAKEKIVVLVKPEATVRTAVGALRGQQESSYRIILLADHRSAKPRVWLLHSKMHFCR